MLGILFVGVAFVAIAGFVASLVAVGVLLRAVLWLILLPFRLLIAGLALVVALPLLVLGLGVAAIAGVAALLVPLTPILLVAGLIWMIVKLSRGHAVPVR